MQASELSTEFINRQRELHFLNELLTRQKPGPAQLILLYGRRRVGKTVLLRHWIEQATQQQQASGQASGASITATYWAATKEPASLQRRKLYARCLNLAVNRVPLFASWDELWESLADHFAQHTARHTPQHTPQHTAQQRHILVLDELPYAAESDPAMLSSLQHAWDQHFKHSQLVLVLCGSHVRIMESLIKRQSPLFGRMTGQWHLEPLEFHTLRQFFPKWSAEERVALYAIVGGIPAYFEWLDASRSLVENIRRVILSAGSMFIAEPQFLLYDEVREPQVYLAILKAIGAGAHTLDEISNESLVNKSNLSTYLATLQELRLVERRVPATLPPAQRRLSRQGRYHISDPYFRFYFRFLDPFQDILGSEPERVLDAIRQNLRAFVGQTTFEELSRRWVQVKGQTGELPFTPSMIGSHWSRSVQIDVVAVNWQTHDLLLGECKWTGNEIDREIVRELIQDKTPKVIKDMKIDAGKWTIHYAFFARTGFTPAATTEAALVNAHLVDLRQIDQMI